MRSSLSQRSAAGRGAVAKSQYLVEALPRATRACPTHTAVEPLSDISVIVNNHGTDTTAATIQQNGELRAVRHADP